MTAGPAGRWFLSPAARRAAGAAALVAVVLCVAAVLLDDAIASTQGADAGWFVRGVVPMLVLAAVSAGVVVVARRWFGLGRNECVQTLVVFLVTGFVTLTIIGVFFRGPGMALVLPWGGVG